MGERIYPFSECNEYGLFKSIYLPDKDDGFISVEELKNRGQYVDTKILAEYFYNGISVQMLIDRGVGNSRKGSKRWVNKLISYDAESFQKNIAKLVAQQDFLESTDIRLYASLNYRSLDKGLKAFMHTIIDMNPIYYPRFFSRINDNFVSAIMSPKSKSTKYWLFDIDLEPEYIHEESLDSLLAHLKRDGIIELFRYRTIHGWHVIVEPFNKSQFILPNSITLQQDGLVLLRAFK